MKEKEETTEQYIHRMTRTEGELFEPTGWISVSRYKYRNKPMLFLECYTDCIYKSGQPVVKFWIKPKDAIHLAWQLLTHSKIWNK